MILLLSTGPKLIVEDGREEDASMWHVVEPIIVEPIVEHAGLKISECVWHLLIPPHLLPTQNPLTETGDLRIHSSIDLL